MSLHIHAYYTVLYYFTLTSPEGLTAFILCLGHYNLKLKIIKIVHIMLNFYSIS